MTTTVITIAQATGTWVVRAGGAVIGESARVIELRESGHAPTIYFPRDDLGMAFLDRSQTTSECPHKGTASHYSIAAKSGQIEDAAWSYENPKEEVALISGYIAFYPDKATVEEI